MRPTGRAGLQHPNEAGTQALTFGIIGVLTGCLGVVFGPLALSKANLANRACRGDRVPVPGTATAGQVLGWISLIQGGVLSLCLALYLAGVIALGGGLLGTGTITFAEEVDRKTFETTNEGTVFTTGYVAMVVRGNGRFGDSRMVVSYRRKGEAAWQILGEYTVDPDWNIYAVVVTLTNEGEYEVAAKTSSGSIIAQNDVTIVER